MGRDLAERAAGTTERYPHRACARLHPAGELGADRVATGLWLFDRLSGSDRILRGHVCCGADCRVSRLCRRPGLSALHAMAAGMARVDETTSLAGAEARISRDAARRLDVVFRSGGIFSILVLLIAWEVFARSGKVTAF